MTRLHLAAINGVIIFFLAAWSAIAKAENYAFQFVCIDNGNEISTPWMDERLSNAVNFSRGREGQNFYWAKFDQRPYGPGAAPMHPAAGNNLWAWVEHRSRHSCDEVCINLRDIDGQLYRYPDEVDKQRAPNKVIIRRHTWYQDDRHNEAIFADQPRGTWNLANAEITPHATSTAEPGNQGVTYCWDAVWTDNYWVALHDESGSGRVTEVEFLDHQDIRHIFRAVPAYPTPAGW